MNWKPGALFSESCLNYFVKFAGRFCRKAETPSLAASVQAISPKPLYPISSTSLKFSAAAALESPVFQTETGP
jgi:hypothetical protein